MHSLHLGAPQIIWLVLAIFVDGYVLAKHGQPNVTTYNIFRSLIATGIMGGLLYWGGFFG